MPSDMSSDLGFSLLQELFPQVDRRMLKAVAIEHGKDVEAAVECIISEILPSICIPAEAPHTLIKVGTEEPKQQLEHHEDGEKETADVLEGVIPSDHCDSAHYASEVPDVGSLTFVGEEKTFSVLNTIDEEHPDQLFKNSKNEHQKVFGETTAGFSEFTFTANEHSNCFHHDREGPDCSSTFVLEENTGSSSLNAHDRDNPDQLCVNAEIEDISSRGKRQENVLTGSHQDSHALPTSMMPDVFFECNNIIPDGNLDLISGENCTTLSSEVLPVVFSNYLRENFGLTNCESHDPEEAQACDIDLNMTCPKVHFTNLSCENFNVSSENEPEDVLAQLDSSHVLEETQKFVKDASTSRTTSASCDRKLKLGGSVETESEKMIHDAKLVNHKEESYPATVETQSSQMCRIDVLEDAVNEAKNSKKTLFASMDSVVLMMREVEDLEKAAKRAKEEAFRGGIDTLAKVEDLREMLLHAKEANDMHAGEVYGEKAILATEARELQSRLQNLSYERNRSLSILNEMRQVLEARIAAAEEVRKTAEQDKLDKEGFAQKALMEQEIIMEKVVQDSKRLQSEAEENSKLREFLMDRGQIVDVLQGEMAVICKDVESLKEKFESQVPLSKILSSSQTSCILASSGSSSKSLSPNLVPEQVNTSELLSSNQTDCFMASSGSSDKSLAPNLVPEHVDMSESPKMTTTTLLPTDNSWENGTYDWKEFVYKTPANDDDWDFIEADVLD